MTRTFSLTAKQKQAQALIGAGPKHTMLFGGSRSGKTFLLTRNTVWRAIKAARSRHAIFRQSFSAVKASIILDTFPKAMELCFPQVDYDLSKTDWYARFPNDSELWFGGLIDTTQADARRSEKVLGMEFATIYLNECSQISWPSVQLVRTRLAQQVDQVIDGHASPLLPRMFYDENPPTKAHWSYRQFIQKIDPETRLPLANPDDYASLLMNPQDNLENIAADYIETLQGLAGRMRRRFLLGAFGEAVSGALFDDAIIDAFRVEDGNLPDMVRIVVAVDPSGSGDTDNADNDAIGIVVAGLGTDGVGYILEDCTVKAGPATWGNVAASAYDRWEADCIVGETNYGGDMVRHVIKTAHPRAIFRKVTASRGKVVRAEPFSSLYENGKVRHVGRFNELEDELCGFTTNGYVGGSSPNRADAAIWALAELFPAMVRPRRVKQDTRLPVPQAMPTAQSWMAS